MAKNSVLLVWPLLKLVNFNGLMFYTAALKIIQLGESETLFESIWWVATNLLHMKGKISGCFKDSTPCSPAMSISSWVLKKWL